MKLPASSFDEFPPGTGKRTRQEKRNWLTRAGARVYARFRRAAILLPSRSGFLSPVFSAGASFWILWRPKLDSSRLGVSVSGLDTSIRETACTLERKTLSRAAPPTPSLAGPRPISARRHAPAIRPGPALWDDILWSRRVARTRLLRRPKMFDTRTAWHSRHTENRELANGYLLSLVSSDFRPSLRENILQVVTRCPHAAPATTENALPLDW